MAILGQNVIDSQRLQHKGPSKIVYIHQQHPSLPSIVFISRDMEPLKPPRQPGATAQYSGMAILGQNVIDSQ